MGPDGAVNIIFRRELKDATDPAEEKAKLVADYRSMFANPFKVAELGYIDGIIERTRTVLDQTLEDSEIRAAMA